MNPAASHKRNSKTKWTEFYIKACTAICNKHNNKTNKNAKKLGKLVYYYTNNVLYLCTIMYNNYTNNVTNIL